MSDSVMNSWFVAADIETLGLSDHAPIIEFGACVADWCGGKRDQSYVVPQSHRFHTYVVHDTYDNCEPYAMSMHPVILRRIATQEEGFMYTHINDLAKEFATWLKHFPFAKRGLRDQVILAGKNFAKFDLTLLRRQTDWDLRIKYRHRILDPGMLYWDPLVDNDIPNQNTCLERAGMHGDVTHNALEDALQVAGLIQHYAGICQMRSLELAAGSTS